VTLTNVRREAGSPLVIRPKKQKARREAGLQGEKSPRANARMAPELIPQRQSRRPAQMKSRKKKASVENYIPLIINEIASYSEILANVFLARGH
jgi:hypothetical protein